MSLFDTFKQKATELLQGAKDQASELTGVELPVDGLIDQAGQTVDDAADAGQNLADTATETVGQAGQGLADNADGAVTDATDRLPGT
jgi:hypothetical protein